MTPFEATRTLVKSQPEVWSQCSDADALERHLDGSFGEIRITRLEPETAVAWEGEQVCGTVRIEPSAWGTRVTMTARMEQQRGPVTQGPAPGPPARSAPAAGRASREEAPSEVWGGDVRERSRWLWSRLALRFRPVALATPSPSSPPSAHPEGRDPTDILHAALDSLGSAHHRPFSRG